MSILKIGILKKSFLLSMCILMVGIGNQVYGDVDTFTPGGSIPLVYELTVSNVVTTVDLDGLWADGSTSAGTGTPDTKVADFVFTTNDPDKFDFKLDFDNGSGKNPNALYRSKEIDGVTDVTTTSDKGDYFYFLFRVSSPDASEGDGLTFNESPLYLAGHGDAPGGADPSIDRYWLPMEDVVHYVIGRRALASQTFTLTKQEGSPAINEADLELRLEGDLTDNGVQALLEKDLLAGVYSTTVTITVQDI